MKQQMKKKKIRCSKKWNILAGEKKYRTLQQNDRKRSETNTKSLLFFLEQSKM